MNRSDIRINDRGMESLESTKRKVELVKEIVRSNQFDEKEIGSFMDVITSFNESEIETERLEDFIDTDFVQGCFELIIPGLVSNPSELDDLENIEVAIIEGQTLVIVQRRPEDPEYGEDVLILTNLGKAKSVTAMKCHGFNIETFSVRYSYMGDYRVNRIFPGEFGCSTIAKKVIEPISGKSEISLLHV